MTDRSGFSLDMSVNPDTRIKPLPDWVAFDLCRVYSLPGGNLLLHKTQNGQRAVVMPEVFASLSNCIEFKTLDQHTANIIEANPGMQDQQADIRKVLQTMLDNGIMISAKKVCENVKQMAKSSGEKNQAGKPVVAIITWERPEALGRLLDSIAVNCDTEKVHCFYIIDDSRIEENIKQNKALVDGVSSRIKVTVKYFGQDEQQSLLDGLARRVPEHEEAIRFLADQSRWRDQWTSGLVRNMALLLSGGHRLVMMDDDTVCDVYNPPRPKPDITFSDNPREAAFFETEQEWAHQHQSMNQDPINRHMQCLGLPLSEALDVLGQQHLKPASLANATALLVSELNSESPVLLTECGSLGCPGTSSNTWLPNMALKSLQQMLASQRKTTNALNSRLVWSGRNHPHFAPRHNMSPVTGFDNRQFLPPYLPILRNEDRLFGNMLDYILPTGVTLDYPWAVPHSPIPSRKWYEKDLEFSQGDLFPQFFIDQVITQKSSCLSTDPVERLKVLASWFYGLSVTSHEALKAMYRDDYLNSASGQLQLLNSLLANGESSPVNWQNYLRNGIRELNADLEKASRDDFLVSGLPGGLDENELIAFWKWTWAGFASALKVWPEIRKAAAEHLNS
jgi:hypothetical protein